MTGTEGMNSATPVVVNSGGVSARLDRGDMGVDYFLDPANVSFVLRPIFQVYALRGSPEVFPYGKGGNTAYFGSFSSLRADEGWSLSVDISSSFTFAEKRPLDDGIKAYWRRHNFAGASPLSKPDTMIADVPAVLPAEAAPSEPPAPVIVYVPQPSVPAAAPVVQTVVQPAPAAVPQGQPVVVKNASKHICLALGMILTAGSVGVQAYSYLNSDIYEDTKAQNLYRGSYATLGLGVLLTLVGTLYNPKVEFR